MKIRVLVAFLIFTSIFLMGRNAFSQSCCPYIDQLELLPANPTDTSQLFLATKITASSLGNFVSSGLSFPSADSIEVQFCYFAGMLPALQTYYDTIEIGILPAGVYHVNVKTYQTSDSLNCLAGMMNDSLFSFTVSTPTTLNSRSSQIKTVHKIVSQDINPFLLTNFGYINFSLFNSCGQNIYSGPPPLPISINKGIYIIEASRDNATSRLVWVKN